MTIYPNMAILIFLTYLFLVNVLTFGLYANDKHRAYFSKRRTPEALLLGLAVMGGAYGAASGMVLFSHKTKHLRFRIIVPLFLIIWIAAAVFIMVNLGGNIQESF